MIKHFMILSSSYSTGQRIAMHYIIDDQMNPEMLTSEVKTIKELSKLNIKEILPFKSRSLTRMLTISTRCFCFG